MTKAIQSYPTHMQMDVALRRIKAGGGGIGYLAAKNFVAAHRIASSHISSEPAHFTDPNALKIQEARRSMIEMGLIKTVEQLSETSSFDTIPVSVKEVMT